MQVTIKILDSTTEYISAVEIQAENNMYLKGLRCATVLIGVYNKDSGLPLIGVINQPFYALQDSRYASSFIIFV